MSPESLLRKAQALGDDIKWNPLMYWVPIIKHKPQ